MAASAIVGKFFGYDDKSGRRWINLDHVSLVNWFPEQQKVELFVAFGVDGKSSTRIELTGDAAKKLVEAIGFIEATGSHVK